MKILLVIDHLGLGGAQRQIVELACGLQQRGHDVTLFNYFPHIDHFRARVLAAGVRVHDCRKGRGFSLRVLGALAGLIRNGGFDLVVSYLNSPNLYSELARLAGRGTRLVVSERVSYHDDQAYSYLSYTSRRLLHGLSDHVVANSVTHAEWLRGKWWLRDKVSCIYNGLDLSYLRSSAPPSIPAPGELRLLAVGRLCPQKNPLALIQALQLFQRRHGYVPQVSWVGKTDSSPAGKECERQVHALLASAVEVRRNWHWLGERPDMPRLLGEHHALIHPSLYEGLPNVVCEALAVGMPVLVSAVCDHALLVADAERGFTFDPNDPRDMAAAIAKLAALPASEWARFASNARRYTDINLTIDRMVTAYEQLAQQLVGARSG